MSPNSGTGDQDDDVSVTSTIDENHDSDEEFSIIRILAERLLGGKPTYLVEWEGFPLASATWEPRSHFNSGTISEWKRFKEKTGRRTALGFKVRHWTEALRRDIEEKRVRHENRNRRRASLGLQTTEFHSGFQTYLDDNEDSLEDYEEPSDDERMEVDQGKNPTSEAVSNSGRSIVGTDGVVSAQSQGSSSAGGTWPSGCVTVGEGSRPKSPTSTRRGSGQGSKSVQETVSGKTGRPASAAQGPASTPTRALSASNGPSYARRVSAADDGRDATQVKVSKPTTNIFLGGRVRKARQTLLEAAKDSSKEPKLLKPRYQNLVQKGQRDIDGAVAPIHPPAALMSLNGSETIILRRNTASGSASGNGAAAVEAPLDHQIIAETESGVSLPAMPIRVVDDGLDRTSGPQDGNGTKRRKRSVHWDVSIIAREGSDESSLFVAPSPPPLHVAEEAPDRAAAAAFSEPSSDGGISKPATQSISKLCGFGTEEARPISLAFTDLPANADTSWLVAFRNQSFLAFTHSCTSHDFKTQIVFLREKQLCRGHISESTDREAVESISNRLHLGGTGLICLTRLYCIVIFPTRCADWSDEIVEPRNDSVGCSLRYSIFEPKALFTSSMLAPLSYATAGIGQDTGMSPSLPAFDLFLGHKYDQLLPPNARVSPKHVFFLAFPPSAREEAGLVSQWLRLLNSTCDIRTSLRAGDWFSFLKLESGTLILHEDALWATRTFPKFADILHAPSKNFAFCLFRRSVLSTPLPSSLDPSTPDISERELFRIFRSGTAILVTPSFLVSQPVQAYNFLKWFFQNFSRASQEFRIGKLVVCAGFEDWLFDLALERSKRSEQVQTNVSQKTTEIMKHAIEQTVKTLTLVRKLHLESADGGESPLVFAPEAIDSNDEQSLVNWFGWWTIVNMAHLRKFFVLGSSDQNPGRLTRLVQVEDYQASPAETLQSDSHDRNEAHSSGRHHGALQLAISDEGGAIRDSLAKIEKSMLTELYRPVSLYRFAVSYWDMDMPYHFNDINSTFGSYTRWFCFFAEHMRRIDWTAIRGGVNTYAGLFYTIEGAWDRAKYPQGVKPARRPWLALYRPANPHKKPWQTAELLIWDYATREKYSGDADVYMNDLIEAQRELIKVVREQSEAILNLPLERVWLGGSSAHDPETNYSHPLDITLNWLGNLLPNIRNWLPAPEVRLPDRGWKRVNPAGAPLKARGPGSGDAMDLDHPDELECNSPRLEKTVFHPPLMEGQKAHTRSRNSLYDWAERQRSRGVRGQAEFTFQPTMKWYEQQLEQGRGFHHINVMSWKSFFARYSIDDPKRI